MTRCSDGKKPLLFRAIVFVLEITGDSARFKNP